ncbi:hypothetical protein BSKO_05145 [Bryopsis sp. KO-2023]|nr:hypothetical protein BSKO_05145 [Bryopsis sp. KO-2023]
MDQILEEIQQFAQSLYSKVQSALSEIPAGSLQLTGLLGVAALLAGLYHYRQNRRGGRGGGDPPAVQSGRGQTSISPALAACKPGSSPSGGPGSVEQARPVPLSRLRSQLSGIKTITMSVPGVLLEQWDPSQLEEEATVRPDAAEIVKEMASCMNTYLMSQVSSDIGEAVVRGALEAAGVIGKGPRQVPPHHLILCDTLKGKVAVVRQIEPELHVDGDHNTVSELQRFIPQQLHIFRKGGALATGSKGIIGHAPSLAEALNVSV